VVVDNLYVIGVSISPDEADSPLIVYSYAMLPLPVGGQSFKSIPWRNTEIVNRRTPVKHPKLSEGEPLNRNRKLARVFAPEDSLGFLALEAFYHRFRV